MDNKKRVVISGYYGFNNIGDEAILFAMIKLLQDNIPNINITVLSNDPEKTKSNYKVNTISRWDIKGIFKSIKSCNMLISGGGSLLQDITSYKTIPYYLGIVQLAILMHKQVVFYSQGIGPINHPWNKWLVKVVANKVNHIFVREIKSKQLLESMNVKTPIEVSIDPVFGINLNFEVYSNIKTRLKPEKKVGIYLRPWKNNKLLVKTITEVSKKLIQDGYEIYMICMQYKQDLQVAKDVVNLVSSRNIHIIGKSLNMDEALAYTACFDFIIGMRLHSLIMAFSVGVPIIAISYDPKVENVMDEMCISHCIKLENLTYKNLMNKIRWIEHNIKLERNLINYIKRQKIEEIYMPIHYIKNKLLEDTNGL
ncbi:polysaccharide pyruvyl transferase CsaB [Candidatus Epulonipiscium fishelsonii]|nr:polysaccharide pyruvyl transferase CsaB [Epulopiscium sp. SCG-C06WGA-EpuloA1]